MALPIIEIKKKSTVYELALSYKKGNYQLKVEVDDLGRFTLKNGNDFTFVRSNRDVVRAIGMLLVRASELTGKEKS